MSDVRGKIARIIEGHPFASGDATADELAKSICDALGPLAVSDYEPTMDEVLELREGFTHETTVEYPSVTRGNYLGPSHTRKRKRTGEEYLAALDKVIKAQSEYVIKLSYLRRMGVANQTDPSWWRRALDYFGGKAGE